MNADITADSDASSDSYTSYLWGRRCGTVYRVRLSILYHLKRERFFDHVDKACSMLTAIAATAAVGLILKDHQSVDATVAVITAVLSLVPLVFNPANMARQHGQTAAEFRRLLADCERAGERWDEAACDQFAGRVVELEATEPAPMAALVADCQNQLAVARGKPEDQVALRWYERLLMHWWMFDASAINARTKQPA